MHYWRVRAANSSGNSTWSDVWSFTTATPSALTELTPVSVKLFPNPAVTFITVESASLLNELVITDLSGKQIIARPNLTDTSLQLDVSWLPVGSYFCVIETTGQTVIKQFTRQ